jgi:hypothetical protein
LVIPPIHPPLGSIKVLSVRPLGDEIRKDLGLDYLVRRVGKRFVHELHRPLRDPDHGIWVASNLS